MLVGMWISITSLKIHVMFLRTLRIESLYDPAVPLLGIYPKEIKSAYKEMPAYPCLLWMMMMINKLLLWIIIHNSQNFGISLDVPINTWMDKENKEEIEKGWIDIINLSYIHVWKYHSEFHQPVQLMCININTIN